MRRWHAVAAWTWDAGDDVCGICRCAYDGCPPEAKHPGDDSPVVWGTCGHAYHLQCIQKVCCVRVFVLLLAWLGLECVVACARCVSCLAVSCRFAFGDATPPLSHTRAKTKPSKTVARGAERAALPDLPPRLGVQGRDGGDGDALTFGINHHPSACFFVIIIAQSFSVCVLGL